MTQHSLSSRLQWLAFVAAMSGLGNLLFFVSQSIAPIVPPQVALDLSHTGTFVAALYGGPVAGLVTGLLVGLGPGVIFGPAGWLGLMGLWGLPVGKALTGLTAGLLADWTKVHQRRWRFPITIAILVISYVPEFLFTVFFFQVLTVIFLPTAAQFLLPLLPFILSKAWLEIGVMSLYMAGLSKNLGFTRFMTRVLPGRIGYLLSSRGA